MYEWKERSPNLFQCYSLAGTWQGVSNYLTWTPPMNYYSLEIIELVKKITENAAAEISNCSFWKPEVFNSSCLFLYFIRTIINFPVWLVYLSSICWASQKFQCNNRNRNAETPSKLFFFCILFLGIFISYSFSIFCNCSYFMERNLLW